MNNEWCFSLLLREVLGPSFGGPRGTRRWGSGDIKELPLKAAKCLHVLSFRDALIAAREREYRARSVTEHLSAIEGAPP